MSGTAPSLAPDGRYQIAREKVRLQTDVPLDEIDLESGFIMLPRAIPEAVAPPVPLGPTPPGPLPPGPVPPEPPGPGPQQLQTSVELSFTADRDQLFAVWNAIANLADMAGKVNVTIHAEKPDGFDKSKLQNGVIEPLQEGDLISTASMKTKTKTAHKPQKELARCWSFEKAKFELAPGGAEEWVAKAFQIPADAIALGESRRRRQPLRQT